MLRLTGVTADFLLPMRKPVLFLLATWVVSLLCLDIRAAEKPKKLTCCEEARARKKECTHNCCINAHKKKQSCVRCNPNKEDLVQEKPEGRNQPPGK